MLAQSSAVSLANQLTATAVVLPFICIAVGGSPLAASLIYPAATLTYLVGTLVAPILHSTGPIRLLLAATALFAGLITAGDALGGHLAGSSMEYVFVVAAALLGLLGGLASVWSVDAMATSLLPHHHGALPVLQSAISAAVVLMITVLQLAVFGEADALSSHLTLLWAGAVAFTVAVPFSLMIVAPPVDNRDRTTLGQVLRIGWRQLRGHRWFVRFLLVQTCFVSVTLGTAFFSAHGAALHGDAVGNLHLIVAFTAIGLVTYAVAWSRARQAATVRGLYLFAGALTIVAALLCIAADEWVIPAENWLFGIILAIAAVAAQVVYTGQRVWLLRSVTEHRSVNIAFSQLLIGVVATVVALVFGELARLRDEVWPVYFVLGLTVLALATVRAIPTVKLAAGRHRADPRPGPAGLR